MKKIYLLLLFIFIVTGLSSGQGWVRIHSGFINRAKIITINNERTLFFQTFGLTGAPFIGCKDSTIFRTYKVNTSDNRTFKPYPLFLEPFKCTDFVNTESCSYFPPEEFDVSNTDSGLVIKYYQSMIGGNCMPPHIRKIVSTTGYVSPADTVGATVIRISPFNDRNIFTLINKYLFKSSDRGQSWAAVQGVPGNLRDVVINPYDSNYVYLISSQNQNTMLISSNGGVNFNTTAVNFSSSGGLYFRSIDTILTYQNSNLYRSDDKGLSWALAGTGPGNFTCLELHPGLKKVYYAGFDNLGLYVSTNSGAGFTLYNNTFSPSNYIYGILKARPDKDSIYVVTGNGVYIAFDQYITGLTQTSSTVPNSFTLDQNYPNPFNPVSNLGFGISDFGFVSLKVYDVLGIEVTTLVNERKRPGSYEVVFDGTGFASGIYFYRLEVDGEMIDTKRMILLK